MKETLPILRLSWGLRGEIEPESTAKDAKGSRRILLQEGGISGDTVDSRHGEGQPKMSPQRRRERREREKTKLSEHYASPR